MSICFWGAWIDTSFAVVVFLRFKQFLEIIFCFNFSVFDLLFHLESFWYVEIYFWSRVSYVFWLSISRAIQLIVAKSPREKKTFKSYKV